MRRAPSSYKGVIKGTKFLKQQGKAEEDKFHKGRLRRGSEEHPQTAPQLVMEVNCFPNGCQITFFFSFLNMIETDAILLDAKDHRCLNDQGVYFSKKQQTGTCIM